MFEFVYTLLEQVGFTHPLHPAITHLPMGLCMGAFLFALGSLKVPRLVDTAYHCVVLALLFVIPTVVLGVMDWQHFYAGEWTGPITTKVVLAGLLTVLLLAAAQVGRGEGRTSKSKLMLALYSLCLLTCIGLGFSGGEIQYG
jgi:uncharacterized membrane protein